jgi:DNA-binding MltR family transcriptional regulator
MDRREPEGTQTVNHSLADSDPAFGNMNRMLRLAFEEEDRGFVLSMAAFVEDALRRLLLAYMQPGKASNELLDGFNAPLGTLSSRIKACAALGLLTTTQYSDLELARKIRNEFAHGWEPCALSQPKVAALVQKMSGDRFQRQESESPKAKFHASLTCVLTEVELLRNKLYTTNQRVPLVAFQLVAGDTIADFSSGS